MVSINALKYILTCSVLAAGAFIGLTQCKTGATDDQFFLNLNDTVSYVGIEACRTCHTEHYHNFIRTGMGQSFGSATREKSKAQVTSSPVYDPNRDMYYLARWVGEQLQVIEYRLKGTDTVHKRSEFVSHIIGSGQHTNSHLWTDNGFLYQAPLTWYAQQGKWDLPPGYETSNTGFARKIDIECMSCHNAMPAVEEGSVNRFTKLPGGIDCERCHGPGELHVQLKTSGVLVDVSKETDRSIVNPARLPWKLQVDICQRCHLQGNNVLKPGKDFIDFRPGMKLSDVFDVFMPETTSDEFYMAGHAERLQMSACFKASNTKDLDKYNPKVNFTCITCHNPHKSVKETNTTRFNQACKNCHNQGGKSKLADCGESVMLREKTGDNCVQCHMPSTSTEDIPHVTVHDHFIRKNYKQIQGGSAESFKLYAVNNSKPDANTELKGYITWFEKFDPKKEWLKTAETQMNSETDAETRIHFHYANSDWAALVELASGLSSEKSSAWTCYRIGKAFDRLNRLEQSINWYKSASVKLALHAGFVAEYGNALIRLGRNAEALAVLEPAVKQQPKEVLLLTNTGLAKLNTGKLAEGKTLLQQSVSLDPEQYNAWSYLLQLYQKVNDAEGIARCRENMRRIDAVLGGAS